MVQFLGRERESSLTEEPESELLKNKHGRVTLGDRSGRNENEISAIRLQTSLTQRSGRFVHVPIKTYITDNQLLSET